MDESLECVPTDRRHGFGLGPADRRRSPVSCIAGGALGALRGEASSSPTLGLQIKTNCLAKESKEAKGRIWFRTSLPSCPSRESLPVHFSDAWVWEVTAKSTKDANAAEMCLSEFSGVADFGFLIGRKETEVEAEEPKQKQGIGILNANGDSSMDESLKVCAD